MRKIVLLCAAGMSTSLLVNKINEAATAENYEIDVQAYPVSEAKNKVPIADVVLLGPQVRYALAKLREQHPGSNIDVIDMRDYGTMNGKAVVATIRRILND
ncbi:PTS sugar transporter subunit IIB [Erysipelothrix larvae]|uniref:PTS sugar transporter subunit IIB n=1 Tax=Erysipelothrix larvae TaxID=1514105 RepID=A0A0X8GYQ4_9FIRM|nr:PTS sugar transporter subunit IIB [Erysipelothrix larvae]AMC92873.1 PTS sugar transporter subunit IIB [Erysipelothrix larvae]